MARFRRFDAVRSEPAPDDAQQIESIRLRRAGLRAALGAVEEALAAPAPGRLDDWVASVRDSVCVLREVWTRHIVDTEAPGGFLDELVEEAPRLANQVRALRTQHTDILDALNRADGDLQLRPAADEDAWIQAVRDTLTELLGSLAHHRQRGADLIYEAYTVDVGGDQ